MSNIPNYDQWAKMNDYLNGIAISLGSNVDVSTWKGIQRAVRLGLAPELFPIGTQFTVPHSAYGDILCDVVAHNYFKSPHDEDAPTMTLLCHNIIISLPYDSPEAFYYASSPLPAGTYNFTIATAYSSWAKGTYQFTLSKGLQAGDYLCISGDAETTLTSLKVNSYDSVYGETYIESVSITSGSGGTSLGTFGVELNHAHRVSHGSNNYKESAIRKFLNSSSTSINGEWNSNNTTKYERIPSRAYSLAGFANGFDEEFLSCVGEVVVPCLTNDGYESTDSTTKAGEKYTLTDKFYLASQKEIFGISANEEKDDSVLFPYYNGATDADRIKYTKNSVAYHWWTRSPRSYSPATVYGVVSNGSMGNNPSSKEYGCVPAFSIV